MSGRTTKRYKHAPWGFYHVMCKTPDGHVLWEERAKNVVTKQGQQLLLDWFTGDETGIPTARYVVLNKSSSSPSEDMSYDVRGTGADQWSELTEYSETSRPQWVHSDRVAQTVTNAASPAVFTINQNGIYLYGAAIVLSPSNASGIATKGNTSVADGTLYSIVAFDIVPRIVYSGNIIEMTIAVTQGDDGV